jgi:hypothetical protein
MQNSFVCLIACKRTHSMERIEVRFPSLLSSFTFLFIMFFVSCLRWFLCTPQMDYHIDVSYPCDVSVPAIERRLVFLYRRCRVPLFGMFKCFYIAAIKTHNRCTLLSSGMKYTTPGNRCQIFPVQAMVPNRLVPNRRVLSLDTPTLFYSKCDPTSCPSNLNPPCPLFTRFPMI